MERSSEDLLSRLPLHVASWNKEIIYDGSTAAEKRQNPSLNRCVSGGGRYMVYIEKIFMISCRDHDLNWLGFLFVDVNPSSNIYFEMGLEITK